MSKILILNTFNYDAPISGGALRCYNIRSSLEKNHVVKTMVLNASDIRYDKYVFDWRIKNNFKYNEINALLLPIVITEKHPEFENILNEIDQYSPDIIWFEHPHLWLLIKKCLKKINKKIKIVYSSHNIEQYILPKIFETFMDANDVKIYGNYIKNSEDDLIRNSNLVICTTNNDSQYIKNLTNSPVLIYENGDYEFNKQDVNKLDMKTCCFIGSGYKPNLDGLMELLTYNDYSTHIDIIGDISYDAEIIKLSNKNVELHGVLNKEEMDLIINRCDVILIPVFYGGGSAIKFRQALLTDKPIVITSHIAKTFTNAEQIDGVFIANSANDFYTLLNNIDRNKTYDRSQLKHQLLWNEILKDLPVKVAELL